MTLSGMGAIENAGEEHDADAGKVLTRSRRFAMRLARSLDGQTGAQCFRKCLPLNGSNGLSITRIIVLATTSWTLILPILVILLSVSLPIRINTELPPLILVCYQNVKRK